MLCFLDILNWIKPKLFSYKTNFILVLWFVLDDYNGPGGRPSSSLGWGGRRGFKSRLPGSRPSIKKLHEREVKVVVII